MKEHELLQLQGQKTQEAVDSHDNRHIRAANTEARQRNAPIEIAEAQLLFDNNEKPNADRAYAATYLALRQHEVLDDALDVTSTRAFNQQMKIRTAISKQDKADNLPALAFDIPGSASIRRYFKKALFAGLTPEQLTVFANLYSGMLDARANSPLRAGDEANPSTENNSLNVIAENTVMMQACLAICRSNNPTIAQKAPDKLFAMGKDIASTDNLPLIVLDPRNPSPPIEMAVKQICVRALEYETPLAQAVFGTVCSIQLNGFLDHTDPGYTLVKQQGVIPLDTAAPAFNTRYEDLVTQTSTLTNKFNALPELSQATYTKLCERLTQIPSWQSSPAPLVVTALEKLSQALETPDQAADLLKMAATNISFVESGIDITEANLKAHIKQVTELQPLNETMIAHNVQLQEYLATLKDKMTQDGNVSPDVTKAITYLNGAIAGQKSALAHPQMQEAMLNNVNLKLQCAEAYVNATPENPASLKLITIRLAEAQRLLDKGCHNDAVTMLEAAYQNIPDMQKGEGWTRTIKELQTLLTPKDAVPPSPLKAPALGLVKRIMRKFGLKQTRTVPTPVETETPVIKTQALNAFTTEFTGLYEAIKTQHGEMITIAQQTPALAASLAGQQLDLTAGTTSAVEAARGSIVTPATGPNAAHQQQRARLEGGVGG